MSIKIGDIPKKLRFLTINYIHEAEITNATADLIEALAAEVESMPPVPKDPK